MDPKVHIKGSSGYNPSSNKLKTYKNLNNNPSKHIDKLTSLSKKGKQSKNNQSTVKDYHAKHNSNQYPLWSNFNQKRLGKKENSNQASRNYIDQQNSSIYVKTSKNIYAKGYSSDKSSKSTQPNTSCDSDNNFVSELVGFKIVHLGKTIHDETSDDFDSESIMMKFTSKNRFASSKFTICPNSQEISIPQFVD